MPVTVPNEVDDERHRHDELEQRTSSEADELAEGPEHEVSRLVNGEIDAREQRASARIGKVVQGIDQQRQREDAAGSSIHWKPLVAVRRMG